MDQENKPTVAQNTAMISAATLLSRATGFLRTWACAFALGNTLLTSAYQIANTMPNMIYELVAGGFIATAFLPVFMSIRNGQDKEAADRYASNLLNIAIIGLGIIAGLATIFAPQIIWTQTFKTSGDDAALATWFFRFFAVQIVFYGASGIIGGLLNAQRRFLWPALGSVFNNIIVIITMFGFVPISAANPEAAKVWLAVGTSAGILAQMLSQIPSLMKTDFRYQRIIDLSDPALKETAKLAIPAIIFTVANLVCVSVRTAYAFNVSPVGPSTISYAYQWYQFPYAVLAVSLSTAMFTEMSECAGKHDMEGYRKNLTSGLCGTFFLIIPMAVMLMTNASLLVMLYHAGKFTADDAAMVAQVLQWWAVSLPLYAGYMYFYFAFSAIKKLITVAKVNIVSSVVQVALYIVLSTGIGSWQGLGMIGFPIADCVFFPIIFFTLFIMMRHEIGSFEGRHIAAVAGKTLLAAIVGGAVVIGLQQLMGSTESIVGALWRIVVGGGVGLVATYAVCALMKVEQMQILRDLGWRLFGKMSRKRS